MAEKPISVSELSKDECAIIARALAMYGKSMKRASDNPDQLPGAVAEFRKHNAQVSALHMRFLALS